MENSFGRYKKYVNKYTSDLAKKDPREIHRELRKLDSLSIPQHEKEFVKGTLFRKMKPSARKQMGFGNLTPGSNAALTQTVAAQTQAAAQTLAAQTLAAQSAAQTLAAVQGSVAPPPQFVPAVAPPQSVRITQAGAVPVTNYAQAAGAITTARNALMDASRQLQMVAGAQNLSG